MRLRSSHDAAEVAQETLLRAWRAAPRYRPNTTYSTWLFSIAHREAVNVIRRRQRDERDRARRPDQSVHPPSESLDDVLPDIWRVARETLDHAAFEMIWLRYAEDLEPREIARVVGKTSVAVRVALSRARSRLADSLEQDLPESGVLDGSS